MRSRVFAWKTRRILRIPAGDPPEGEDCECGNFLLAEDGTPISIELGENLRPET